MRKSRLIPLIFVLVLIVSFGVAVLWTQLIGARISLNGYIALFLGIAATLALGMGLMSLVFFSSRRGYDQIDGKDER
jgi:hypothetical protein